MDKVHLSLIFEYVETRFALNAYKAAGREIGPLVEKCAKLKSSIEEEIKKEIHE